MKHNSDRSKSALQHADHNKISLITAFKGGKLAHISIRSDRLEFVPNPEFRFQRIRSGRNTAQDPLQIFGAYVL